MHRDKRRVLIQKRYLIFITITWQGNLNIKVTLVKKQNKYKAIFPVYV